MPPPGPAEFPDDPIEKRNRCVSTFVETMGEDVRTEIEAALDAGNLDQLSENLLFDLTYRIDSKSCASALASTIQLEPTCMERYMCELRSSDELTSNRALFALIILGGDPKAIVPLLIDLINSPDAKCRKNGFYGLSTFLNNVALVGAEFINLILFLSDEAKKPENKDFAVPIACAIKIIAEANAEAPMLRNAVPSIIGILDVVSDEPDALSSIVETLVCIGDRRAIPALKKLLRYRCYGISAALVRFGLEEVEVANMALAAEAGEAQEAEKRITGLTDYQRAIYDLLQKKKDLKRTVFEGTKFIEALPDRQAWLTINSPALSKSILECVVSKVGRKRDALDRVLHQTLGKRSGEIKNEDHTYYADEILDAIYQFVANSGLKNDAELAALFASQAHSGNARLRYFRREKADMGLGDKCGDCTAKGSINFGNSLTWFVNPAYQILKMFWAKNFIGKVNFTLGKFLKEDALIIDALEFNPQAKKGKPLYEDSLRCFDVALQFIRELAARENRRLFGLTFSNSSGATDILESSGQSLKGKGQVNLVIPDKDIERTMGQSEFCGLPQSFFQMLDMTDGVGIEAQSTAVDAKLRDFEYKVINPAQIAHSEVAEAMRRRDFNTAARLILQQPDLVGSIRGLYGLSPEISLSPKFIADRLNRLFPAQTALINDASRPFFVGLGKFVRL